MRKARAGGAQLLRHRSSESVEDRSCNPSYAWDLFRSGPYLDLPGYGSTPDIGLYHAGNPLLYFSQHHGRHANNQGILLIIFRCSI